MARKTSKNTVSKPLPSILTVANPATFRNTHSAAAAPASSAPPKPAAAAEATKTAPKRARTTGKLAAGKTAEAPLAQAVPVPADSGPARVSTRKAEVTFHLLEPDARRAFVCGSFNDWEPEQIAMTRNSDGSWVASVSLPRGRHEYKFVVDGKWVPDLGAQEHVPNEFGSVNSVIEVSV
jgi:hypothetical protein